MTLSAERRRRLVALAREREVLVVEDNPYGMLRYEGQPEDPLYKLDGGDYVVYLGTFSKILSPGIRVGWILAPPPVMEKIVLGKQATDLCTSTLTQYFVAEFFAEGRWREYVESLVDIYRARRDAMLDSLERHFPAEATWTRPEGGSSSGPRCPTTSTPPTSWRERCARTSPSSPGRPRSWTAGAAARCGSTSRARTRTRSARASAGSAASSPSRSRLYGTFTHQTLPAPSSQRAPASGDPGGAGIRPGAAGSDKAPDSDSTVVPFRRSGE